jgi:hypothetical protein
MLECRPGKCDVGCSCKPFEVPPILYGAVYSKDGTNANTENSRGRMEPYSDRQDQSENEDWESSRLKFCEFIGQLSAFLILCLRSTSMVILVKHTRIPDKPLQRQVNVSAACSPPPSPLLCTASSLSSARLSSLRCLHNPRSAYSPKKQNESHPASTHFTVYNLFEPYHFLRPLSPFMEGWYTYVRLVHLGFSRPPAQPAVHSTLHFEESSRCGLKTQYPALPATPSRDADNLT